MDMLHQGNKKCILYYILSVMLFFGCNKYKTYNEKEIANIREKVQTASIAILGEEYDLVYQMANDSIVSWAKHKLGLWKYFGNAIDYQLDQIFCVNKIGNKVFFSILRRSVESDAVLDSIWHFYGVKINGQWYFFDGAAMVLPREYYQEDIHTPLSFEKLKQIATNNIYRGYLYKNKQGEWVINDNFFSDLTSCAWSENWKTNTQEEWDVIYLQQVKKNWERKDPW